MNKDSEIYKAYIRGKEKMREHIKSNNINNMDELKVKIQEVMNEVSDGNR